MSKRKAPRKAKSAGPKRKTAARSKSPFASRVKPRVDLRLAYGSITEVDAQAVVLGLFEGVHDLPGAAHAVDQRLGGAITDTIERRMFAGKVGEIFIMPAARHDIRADLVICAGMGRFDKFELGVLERVAENVARTLVRSRVSDFALALFGATRGGNLYDGLTHLVNGFFRGVRGSRERNPLRSITICENDLERCGAIEAGLAKLYRTARSKDVEVTLEHVTLPQTLRKEDDAGPGSVVLQATQEAGGKKNQTKVRMSILSTGKKATAFSAITVIEESELADLVAEVDGDEFLSGYLTDLDSDVDYEGQLKHYGTRVGKMLLPPEVARLLRSVAKDRRIVLMHDSGMARVPWETLRIGEWFPAARGGMSRQFITDHMPVARWLEERRYGEELDLLLIVDPTEDPKLEGAVKEGNMVKKVAKSLPGVTVKELVGKAATKAVVKRELSSGKYDVLHYAGHTQFYPDDPGDTGIVCAHHKVLTGNDLAGMKDLPALVFFNSCESGRVGGLTQKGAIGAQRNVGLAESFLQGGVANYVGTHWVVSDDSAPAFVKAFYGALLQREPIGTAVSKGRQAVRKVGSFDWADYIHYGSPDFVLKFGFGLESR